MSHRSHTTASNVDGSDTVTPESIKRLRDQQKHKTAMKIVVELLAISGNDTKPRVSRCDAAAIFSKYEKAFRPDYVSKAMVYRYRDFLLKRKDPPPSVPMPPPIRRDVPPPDSVLIDACSVAVSAVTGPALTSPSSDISNPSSLVRGGRPVGTTNSAKAAAIKILKDATRLAATKYKELKEEKEDGSRVGVGSLDVILCEVEESSGLEKGSIKKETVRRNRKFPSITNGRS
eukprot:scaffold1982_cov93-Amphora_coffeaeformis.AAC.65